MHKILPLQEKQSDNSEAKRKPIVESRKKNEADLGPNTKKAFTKVHLTHLLKQDIEQMDSELHTLQQKYKQTILSDPDKSEQLTQLPNIVKMQMVKSQSKSAGQSKWYKQ